MSTAKRRSTRRRKNVTTERTTSPLKINVRGRKYDPEEVPPDLESIIESDKDEDQDENRNKDRGQEDREDQDDKILKPGKIESTEEEYQESLKEKPKKFLKDLKKPKLSPTGGRISPNREIVTADLDDDKPSKSVTWDSSVIGDEKDELEEMEKRMEAEEVEREEAERLERELREREEAERLEREERDKEETERLERLEREEREEREKEEAERLEREEEERLEREEAERLEREEEEERQRRKRQEEMVRLEEERRQREKEERDRLEREERRQKEEAERKAKEEADRLEQENREKERKKRQREIELENLEREKEIQRLTDERERLLRETYKSKEAEVVERTKDEEIAYLRQKLDEATKSSESFGPSPQSNQPFQADTNQPFQPSPQPFQSSSDQKRPREKPVIYKKEFYEDPVEDPRTPPLPFNTNWKRPQYHLMSKRQKEAYYTDFRIKYELLNRELGPGMKIPDFLPGEDLNIVHDRYERYLCQILGHDEASLWNFFLILVYKGIELLGTWLGIPCTGFTIYMTRKRHKMRNLLIQMAEQKYLTFSANWPVPVQILWTVVSSLAIFIVYGIIGKKFGDGALKIAQEAGDYLLDMNSGKSVGFDANGLPNIETDPAFADGPLNTISNFLEGKNSNDAISGLFNFFKPKTDNAGANAAPKATPTKDYEVPDLSNLGEIRRNRKEEPMFY